MLQDVTVTTAGIVDFVEARQFLEQLSIRRVRRGMIFVQFSHVHTWHPPIYW